MQIKALFLNYLWQFFWNKVAYLEHAKWNAECLDEKNATITKYLTQRYPSNMSPGHDCTDFCRDWGAREFLKMAIIREFYSGISVGPLK